MPAPPNYPAEKLLDLAARAMGTGDFAQAESHLQNVLFHDPTSPVALHHLGLRAYLRGDTAAAQSLLARARASAPDSIDILTSYGTLLHELSLPRESLDIFLRVLALDSALPEIWNAAGICFQETGRPASAVEFYLRALNLRPHYPEALSNLAAVLIHEGDTASAIEHLLEARKLNPQLPDVHNNLGIALRNRFQYAASIDAFREAHRLAPDNPDILGGLGEVLSLIHDPEAEIHLRRSVELRPEDPEKHWNLSHYLLKTGNYAEGWREYDWRWQRIKNQKPLRTFPQPLWRGQPLANATIFLHAEQGFGDTLQFLRYVPLVLAEGARVILEVQPALKRLAQAYAQQLDPNILVLAEGAAEGETIPPFEFHTPLMSLPLAFATTLETVPPPQRFTPPAPSRPPNDPLRIGLSWHGNPTHARDLERSIPFAALKPLFDIPGLTWISLQPATHPVTNSPLDNPPLRDFLDTANLIDTLDLVITVDTAVAHLAASQGVPTWIMLPFVSEWRWLQPPANNPWYPQARLFRQTTLPDGRPQADLWQPLIAEVAQALALTCSSSYLNTSHL